MKFCEDLVQKYNFHQFDSLVVSTDIAKTIKKDPTITLLAKERKDICKTLFAAKNGEVRELEKLHASGVNIHGGDYDKRTGLHIAVSEGHLNIVKYYVLVSRQTDKHNLLNPRDRWGRTPLDDAIYNGHERIAKFLLQHGGISGMEEEKYV